MPDLDPGAAERELIARIALSTLRALADTGIDNGQCKAVLRRALRALESPCILDDLNADMAGTKQ